MILLGIDQDQTLHNPALPQAFHHLGRNIDKSPPGWRLKPQLFSIAFHDKIAPFFVTFSELTTGKQIMGEKSIKEMGSNLDL